jgi:uncharacterized protein Veg
MALPSQSCLIYSQVSSNCSCLLIIQDQHGRKKRINLKDAITIEYADHFVIQTPITGAKVSPDSSFTITDIDTLICGCASSGGNSTAVAHRLTLSGAQIFTLPANTTQLSYSLITSSAAGVTPTLTTIDGTDPLVANESGGFGSGNSTLSGLLTFTLLAGDEVLISYTTSA